MVSTTRTFTGWPFLKPSRSASFVLIHTGLWFWLISISHFEFTERVWMLYGNRKIGLSANAFGSVMYW